MATPIMPVMNFGQLTPSQVSPFGNLAGSTLGAATTIADLKKRQAMLEQMQQQNQARPDMQAAQLATEQQRPDLLRAQAERARHLAQGGAGAQGFQSPIGKMQADLVMANRMFGEGSPQVKMMERQMQAAVGLQEQRGDMFGTRAQTAGARLLPQTTRQQILDDYTSKGIPVNKAGRMLADQRKFAPLPTDEPTQGAPFQIPGQPQAPQQPVMTPSSQPIQIKAGDELPSGRMAITSHEPETIDDTQRNDLVNQVLNSLTSEEKTTASRQSNQIKSIIASKTTTPAQKAAMVAGARYEGFKDENFKILPRIKKYIGPAGRVRLARDKSLSTLSKKPNQDLIDYQIFLHNNIDMKGEAALAMKILGTETAHKDFNKQFDVSMAWNNPENYEQIYKRSANAFTESQKVNVGTIQDIIKKSKAAGKQKRTSKFDKPAQSLATPDFQDQSQFDAWYSSLSQKDRERYRKGGLS